MGFGGFGTSKKWDFHQEALFRRFLAAEDNSWLHAPGSEYSFRQWHNFDAELRELGISLLGPW
jgi:hypothetical protein